MIMQPQQQHQTNEELCNLFVQSLEAKDEKTILKILECDDEATIRDVIQRIPVHHVRKLVLELRNVLAQQLTPTHLRWLQHVLVLKFSALASMTDNRSIVLPLISLLDDRSSPAYYMKVQALKGKISLLKQLKETRDTETQETVVRVPIERDQPSHMEVDTESDTDSEENFDDDSEDENDDNDADEDINPSGKRKLAGDQDDDDDEDADLNEAVDDDEEEEDDEDKDDESDEDI